MEWFKTKEPFVKIFQFLPTFEWIWTAFITPSIPIFIWIMRHGLRGEIACWSHSSFTFLWRSHQALITGVDCSIFAERTIKLPQCMFITYQIGTLFAHLLREIYTSISSSITITHASFRTDYESKRYAFREALAAIDSTKIRHCQIAIRITTSITEIHETRILSFLFEMNVDYPWG